VGILIASNIYFFRLHTKENREITVRKEIEHIREIDEAESKRQRDYSVVLRNWRKQKEMEKTKEN